MARILILTFGSRGDVQPFAALGAALTARGHDVTLSTGQGFDDLIAAQGLTPAPLSIDMQAMVDSPEVKAALTSPRGWLKAFRSSQALMQRQLDEMWVVARQVAPRIIVYNTKAFAAPWFARKLGAVAVPAFLQPAFVPTGAFPNPIVPLPNLGSLGNRLSGRAMTALMRLGYRAILKKWLPRHPEVPARPGLDPLRGYHPGPHAVPRLHAHSRHIVPKPGDWGADEHVTGYWFLPPTVDWEPPAELASFLGSGPPPVYVGFGSMPSVDGERTASVVLAALRQTKTRAVVARGWGALSGVAAGDDIHVIGGAPHDWLFPRCRAVVHHGGAGTTHEGLRWGRPTLVCPVFGDQPFWGRAIARLGVGPAPLPLKRLDVDGLSAALRDLQSPTFREKAQALSESLRSEAGAEAAAELILDISSPACV